MSRAPCVQRGQLGTLGAHALWCGLQTARTFMQTAAPDRRTRDAKPRRCEIPHRIRGSKGAGHRRSCRDAAPCGVV